MSYQEGFFLSFDQTRLYYQTWLPKTTTRANLVIVHGLGGHGGMYDNISRYLLPCSFGVCAIDLRGHGKSDGQRGYINTWDEYRQDIKLFLELIQAQNPGVPCFLLGHSMGGLIVIDFVLRYPEIANSLSGLIAFAPALSKSTVSPFKILLGKILSQVCPRFSLSTGIDFSLAVRDPKMVEVYRRDTLRHSLGTARLASEFFQVQDWVKQHIRGLDLPFLMMIAGADKVIFPEGNRQIFQQLTTLKKELREYPESYHELQDDDNYPQVLADLCEWLESCLLVGS